MFFFLIIRLDFFHQFSDTVISWIQLSANIGSRVVRIEPMSCGSNKCPPAFTGQFCETEIGMFLFYAADNRI